MVIIFTSYFNLYHLRGGDDGSTRAPVFVSEQVMGALNVRVCVFVEKEDHKETQFQLQSNCVMSNN